ncbi:MAG TPA: SUMF1/EgtB/PvdO family nonheme iron enzyme [Blastocatellia bacterium]|nr:SUMF1/EgtB/PvdO family nonheme iron enzyme [Blastocatellia bacterium]
MIRGENFCQHCGNRASVALQETVIGACYHCGASWRSGWIYCKNCGLDRKRALLLSTSTPASGTLNVEVSQQLEEFPELSKTNCKSCGAEAKPYSRFCEACGNNLVGSSSSKSESAPPPSSFPQVSPESHSPKLNNRESTYQTSATIFEPRSLAKSDNWPLSDEPKQSESRNIDSGEVSNVGPSVSMSAVKNSTAEESVRPTNFTVLETPEKPQAPINSVSDTEVNGSQAKTVVTPLPPFGGEFRSKNTGSIAGVNNTDRKLHLQPLVLIGLALLLILLLVWWFKGDSLFSSQPLPAPSVNSPNSKTSGSGNSTSPTNKNASGNMVYVPGGTLEMGRNNGDEYETPVHTVSVSPFFLDRTEVTNEEYQQFVMQTGHRAPSHWREGKFPTNSANLPVVNVSWDDANAYAKWIGKRLPTEAEWEFAARGSDGKLYPWGNSWNAANANAGKESGGAIVKVGSFPNGASQFGILDMCGNVWEWTSSSLTNYSDETKEIAPGKVIRGGSFDTPSKRATATYRGVLPPDRLRDKTGFRLAKDAK